MSVYFYNHKFHVGFVLIAKNSSTSIEPYLLNAGFKPLPVEDLPSISEKEKFFYILRNPIDRFCSGIVETYLSVNYDRNGNFGTSITQKALLSLSDYSAQEFCFNLLTRIPTHNSRNRKEQNNIPVNEGLGFREDMHTMLQSRYISWGINVGHDMIPISIHRSSDVPQILHDEININPKQSLLTSNVKHLNQSTDHKKRMNDNLKSILVANQNNAVFDHIWDYLNTDIALWNESIMRRYMQQHHRNDTIDT